MWTYKSNKVHIINIELKIFHVHIEEKNMNKKK